MGFNKAPRYVLVNVPAFVAQAVDRGALALDTNVVVGKPARATPRVDAQIVEVNFYPTWSVPDIVAQNDLIPTIRKNPNYLYEQHFSVMRDWKAPPLDPASIDWASPQVVSYKFRQDPGPQNALGVVRINMPNKHSVYMHDTPLKTPVRAKRARLSPRAACAWRKCRSSSPGCSARRAGASRRCRPRSTAARRSTSSCRGPCRCISSISPRLPAVTASPSSALTSMAAIRPSAVGDEQQDAVVAQQSRAVTP